MADGLRLVLVAGLLLLPSCSGAAEPGQPTVRVGVVRLHVDVATSAQERERGLRGREVPLGYGMAFPYPGGAQVRFTMSGVDRPLVGVFARSGRALTVERMAPCAGTVAQCPLYGPFDGFDLVVEAAPESLPSAKVGDEVQVEVEVPAS